ncbi:hypothetical protein JOS77_21150 [Chromobacterium haemolyticum]|nr:hypothetical protein JOS77_21150 [Chromobacterium haemolyticum]
MSARKGALGAVSTALRRVLCWIRARVPAELCVTLRAASSKSANGLSGALAQAASSSGSKGSRR